MEPISFSTVLILFSGLCWSIVYVEAVRLGFRDKTYAIPFWALALNIAWEVLNTGIGYHEKGLSTQIGVNVVWMLLDLLIVYTYFRYGIRHFPNKLSARWFLPWSLLGFLTAFLLQYLFIFEFGLDFGRAYAAFLQNLLMSVLFIQMLVQRGSSHGQSLVIAVGKWLGTLAPTILFGFVGARGFDGPSPFILSIGLLCAAFDLIYIGMLIEVRKRERLGESTAVLF